MTPPRKTALTACAALGLVLPAGGCGSEDSGSSRAAAAANRFTVVGEAVASQGAGSAATGSELATVTGAAPRRGPAALRPRAPAYQQVIPGSGFLAAYLRGSAAELRATPGGRVVNRVRKRTEFGSLKVLAVLARRNKGRWLQVISPELGNGGKAWVDARQMWLYRVPWALDVDLSARRVTMFRNHRHARSFPVAVGRPGSETPQGRFAVTDKLLIDPGSPYGCCVLALSGHQPQIPQGWGGGDRIGIHATDNPSSIGQAASLGCLRASERVMRSLVYRIPLGSRVNVHA